jgi:hypothetical protein
MTKRKRLTKSQMIARRVPWMPPVVAFRKGSSIRETFAQWWEPDLHSDFYYLLTAICPRTACAGVDEAFGGEKMRHKWKSKSGKTVLLDIRLDYPLREAWERPFKVSTKRIGEVFGLAHDLYREIYLLDDVVWLKNGHKQAPIVGKKTLPGGQKVNLLNRQGGAHVWGHDIIDLVFESFSFKPSAKATAYIEAHRAFSARKRPPKNAKPPRFNVKHSIGTVSFFIGS